MRGNMFMLDQCFVVTLFNGPMFHYGDTVILEQCFMVTLLYWINVSWQHCYIGTTTTTTRTTLTARNINPM